MKKRKDCTELEVDDLKEKIHLRRENQYKKREHSAAKDGGCSSAEPVDTPHDP